MFKYRRRSVVAVAAAAAVLLLLAGLLIKANRILKYEIEKALGRNFSVESISLGLGGVDAHGVRFRRGNEVVLRIDRLTVRAGLMSLFDKRYSLSRVTAENPVLLLNINKSGEFENPFSLPGASDSRDTSAPLDLEIKSLRILGGTLTLRDARLPEPYRTVELENRFLSLDDFSYPLKQNASKLELSALLKGRLAAGEVKCDGKINMKTHGADLRVAVEDMKLLDDAGKGPAVRAREIRFTLASAKENARRYVIPELFITNPFLRIETDRQGRFVNPLRLPESGDHSKSRSSLVIDKIHAAGGELVYLDGKVAGPPHPTRIESASLTITGLSLPFENRWTGYALSARVPGRAGAATFKAEGKTNCRTFDTDAKIALSGLDITGFKPYFQKKGDADVSRGTLGVTMNLTVRSRNINGPGRAVLKDLEFSRRKGLGDRFIGAPRSLVLRLLKSGNNEIVLDFIIAGNVNDPKFNIAESFIKRLTIGLAKDLGVTVVDAGKSVVELGAKGAQEVGKGIRSIGTGLQRLFRK